MALDNIMLKPPGFPHTHTRCRRLAIEERIQELGFKDGREIGRPRGMAGLALSVPKQRRIPE
jgi:hypothetical protein